MPSTLNALQCTVPHVSENTVLDFDHTMQRICCGVMRQDTLRTAGGIPAVVTIQDSRELTAAPGEPLGCGRCCGSLRRAAVARRQDALHLCIPHFLCQQRHCACSWLRLFLLRLLHLLLFQYSVRGRGTGGLARRGRCKGRCTR